MGTAKVNRWDFALTEININVAESAKQEQTARMCSLILLYTLRKV